MNKIKFTCCIFCLHSKELQGPEQSPCSFPPKATPLTPRHHGPPCSLQPLCSTITTTLSARKDFQSLIPPHVYLFSIESLFRSPLYFAFLVNTCPASLTRSSQLQFLLILWTSLQRFFTDAIFSSSVQIFDYILSSSSLRRGQILSGLAH